MSTNPAIRVSRFLRFCTAAASRGASRALRGATFLWRRLLLGLGLMLGLGLGLPGLSPQAFAQDAAKEPVNLVLRVQASPQVNPDASQRPSPIKVRIYELKDVNAFNEGDYFALEKSDKAILGADLLHKDEFILRPGESRTIERKSKPQTVAIGVIAAYRDLATASWRAVFPLPEAADAAWYRALFPSKTVSLDIELQVTAAKISQRES